MNSLSGSANGTNWRGNSTVRAPGSRFLRFRINDLPHAVKASCAPENVEACQRAAPFIVLSCFDDVPQLFQVVERLNFHWLGHFGNRHDKDLSLVSLHCRVHVREMVELVFRDDRSLALIVVVNGQRPLGTHYKFPLVASQDSSFFVRNYGFSLPDILNFGWGGYYLEDSYPGPPRRVAIVSYPLFIRSIRNPSASGSQIHSVLVSAASSAA